MHVDAYALLYAFFGQKGEASMISVGSEVHIKSCQHGTPGVVVRFERSRVVVYWADLDYLSRHAEDTLMEAPAMCTGAALVQ